MVDIVSLASTGLAFFVVAVSPGPATISNATIAMSQGRNASLVYGAGLSCGLVFWGIIAASGMGAVLNSSLYLLMVLKIFGGLYLLWLALLSARSVTQPDGELAMPFGDQKWFLKGLILNISNPKSVIAWMAALSIGLDSSDGFGAVAAATFVCICVGFFVNMMYSVLFSMRGMMRGYLRCRRWVNGAVAGLFAVAGFGLIHSAFSR